jgi:hypothetical protein
VGNASGANAQPENTLWLDASDLSLSDGNNVNTWPDASGNGRDASAGSGGKAGPPVFQSSVLNGRPVVRFDPTQNFKPILELSSRIGATSGTIFIIADKKAGASGTRTLLATDNHIIYSETIADNWGAEYNQEHNSGIALQSGAHRLLTHVVRGDGSGNYGSDELYTDGGNEVAFTSGSFPSGPDPNKPNIETNVVGRRHDGDIAEVIHFGTDLNAARRTIVNSYLANKYGLPTGNAEVRPYAYTGAYFDDFAGLGQVSGEAHVDAQSAQLRLRDPQGLADGDVLFFGHDGAGASAYTTGELPSGIDERIRREWRVDESAGDVGTVTVQIDANDLPSITPGQDYFVVIDTDGDGDFTTGTPTTARLTPDGGSIYTASGVDLTDGDYVTLGVGARPETPANLTAESDLNRRVLLDWDAVTLDRTGQGTTISEYRVYRSTTNSFSSATQVATTGPSTTDPEITGLTNNTPYFFWVTAVDDIGESDPQSPAVDATPALKISFASPSSNGSEPDDANGFTVELSDTNNQNVNATLSISALGGSIRSVSGVTSIDNGGSGYAIGDVIGEDDSGDGGTDLQIEVTNVNSGAITGADVVNGGSGYTSAPTSFTTLSGSGSGASFSLGLQAAESDFTLKTTTVSISSNNLTRTLGSGDLAFDNDNIPENTETVVLELSSPSTSNSADPVVGAQATHEVTIQDDDFDRNVFLVDTFGSNTDGATSAPEDPAATYTVETDAPDPVNDTEINYVVDLNAPATTATSDDFTSLSGSVTIPAGNSDATFNLPIADDTAFENDEDVVIRLTNVTNANLDNSTNDRFRQLTHTIVNDDSEPAVTFGTASSSVPDEGTAPSIDVTLSTASGNDITVDLTVTGGTATGGGTDYELKTTTLTFTAGEVSKTLDASDLTITDDALNETNETVELALQNPSSGATIGSTNEHELTITDDDPQPEVDFQNATSSASELDGSASITLELRDPVSGDPVASGRDITVSYSVSGTATGGGTDFTDTGSGSLTIPAGNQTGAITLTLVDDVEAEGDETVDLSITGLTGAQTGGTTDHTFTLEDNDVGSIGPAGVGEASSLALWLDASTLTLSDGNAVDTWPDVSGNNNDASGSSQGFMPQDFVASRLNSRPVVNFPNNNPFTLADPIDATDGSIFIVADGRGGASGPRTLLKSTNHVVRSEITQGADDEDEWGGDYDSGGANDHGSGVSLSLGEHRILTHIIRDDGSGAYASDVNYTNGGSRAETTTGGSFFANTSPPEIGRNHRADIAEVIYFGTDLNETRRILVENYLSAKYELSLDTGNGATDVYAGDLGPDGNQGGGDDYDRGVFGIGRLSASDLHDAAETGGLRFRAASGLDNGDFLTVGYQNPGNGINTSDGFPNGVDQRMSRVWFVSETDPGGDLRADVTFDLSKAALNTLAGDPSGYVLLQQSTPGNNSWNLLQNGADAVSGDQITFQGVDLTDRSAITLATRDPAASPLTGTALTITGTGGNEGDAPAGELGGDAGWRLIGPPVTGATAGDLVSGSDPNGSVIEFGLPAPMFYRWDDTAPSSESSDPGNWVEVGSAGDDLKNGRGYLLFLFDDEGIPDADPIDPDLTLDVAAGSVPDAGTDIPATGLNQSARFHVLANPYNQPFDLSSLEQSANGQNANGLGSGETDFQTTVQIWDGGATTAEDGAQAGTYLDVGVNDAADSGSPAMVVDGDIVSAWQGFVVERTSPGSGGTQLTFSSNGTTTGTRTIVGSKSQDGESQPTSARIGLRMTVSDDSGRQIARDQASSIQFDPDATTGWDAFDASKLQPLAGRYAVIGPVGRVRGDTLHMKAVESRPRPLKGPVDIPLRLETVGDVSGQAEVGVESWSGVPDGWTVTLIDTKRTPDPSDDAEQQLSPGRAYSFLLDAPKRRSGPKASETSRKSRDASGSRPVAPPRIARLRTAGRRAADSTRAKSNATAPSTRFRLRVEPSAALPVEFAGIEAVTKDRRVNLAWSTTSETNNAGFTVEHRRLRVNASGDTVRAGPWERLAFVEGSGTTNASRSYRYETNQLDYGPHAFRLRQVDTDGSTSLSDVVRTDIRLDRAYAVAPPRPHPVRRQTTIDVTVRDAQPVAIEVYDVLGRRVAVPFEEEIEGQQTRRIRVDASGLSSGVYFLRVRGDSFATTERMTVVK